MARKILRQTAEVDWNNFHQISLYNIIMFK